MAVLSQLSELERFLLTVPDDTEDAPWMVMADLQVRDVDLLKPILRLHIARHRLPWYLASYLKITRSRPGSERLLEAARADAEAAARQQEAIRRAAAEAEAARLREELRHLREGHDETN